MTKALKIKAGLKEQIPHKSRLVIGEKGQWEMDHTDDLLFVTRFMFTTSN